MRKPIIAGNWKLNNLIAEAESLVDGLKSIVAGVTDVEVVVCPTYTALAAVRARIEGSNIAMGAQDVYHETKGAFTGEISPEMLLDAGCSFAIVGHSERRQYFGETSSAVNKKLRAGLDAGLRMIMCCGETIDQRKANEMETVVSSQVAEGLEGFTADDMANVVMAYEPIWAIGTGLTATPEQANEVHELIRGLLEKQFGAECAERVIIQYGGSVKPSNVEELMAQPHVDGALVGGASLTAEDFGAIVKGAAN